MSPSAEGLAVFGNLAGSRGGVNDERVGVVLPLLGCRLIRGLTGLSAVPVPYPRVFSAGGSMAEGVGRAADAVAAPFEDLGVDHRGADFPVARELLDGAEFVSPMRGWVAQELRRVWQVAGSCVSAGTLRCRGPGMGSQ